MEAAKAQENERLVLMRDTVQQLPPPNYRYCSGRARTVTSPEKKYNMMHFLDAPKKSTAKKTRNVHTPVSGYLPGEKERGRGKRPHGRFPRTCVADCVSLCCCFALVSHVIALLLFLLPPLLRFYLPIFCAEFRKKRMCTHTQSSFLSNCIKKRNENGKKGKLKSHKKRSFESSTSFPLKKVD